MSHIEETVHRIKKWFSEGEKQEPTKVDVFFTERCNLRCKFCNYSKSPSETIKQEMNDETISKLVDDICEMDVKVFGILGGEPFLRKKVLIESMEKVKYNGINGSIVTNGTLLEKNDIERIVNMEWDLIRFSIDGLEQTHDNLRGVNGTFKRTLNTVKNFYEVKKKLESNSPTTEVNFVLTNKNYKSLKELMKELSIYGISFIYILPVIELTEESKNLKINENQITEVNKQLQEAKEATEKLGIDSNLEEIIDKNLFLYSDGMDEIILDDKNGIEKLPPCFLPWYTMNINSDGSATPCAQWPKSQGIKLNNKSLRKVWFEGFEKIRESIKDDLSPWCSRCCVPLVDENMEIRKRLNGT